MKNLIFALALLLPLTASAGKKAQDMTQEEYNAYIKARIEDPRDEEDRKNVVKHYEENSARAARGEKVMTTDEAHKALLKQEKYEEEKYGSEEVQVEQGRFFDKLEGKN